MATYITGHADFFNELIVDSESDEEFEGFDPVDNDNNNDEQNNDGDVNFSMDNWENGDRDPENLEFTGTPGLAPGIVLPDSPEPTDYFNLFVNEEDYKTMATETNRYAQFNPFLLPNLPVRLPGHTVH